MFKSGFLCGLIICASIGASYGEQWVGSFLYSSGRCDESRWIMYSTQLVESTGCLAVPDPSAPQRVRVDCKALSSQLCDATCNDCMTPPSAGSTTPPGCTTNGACVTCSDPNIGLYSASPKCSSNYLALPFNSSYYVLKVFNNNDCTGEVIAATAANADGTTCIPLAGFGRSGSGKFICEGDGTGTLQVFSDGYCASLTEEVPISPETSTCDTNQGSSVSIKAFCELVSVSSPRSSSAPSSLTTNPLLWLLSAASIFTCSLL